MESFDGLQGYLWLRPPGKGPDANSFVTLGGKEAAEVIIHYSVSQLWGKVRGKPFSTGVSVRIRKKNFWQVYAHKNVCKVLLPTNATALLNYNILSNASGFQLQTQQLLFLRRASQNQLTVDGKGGRTEIERRAWFEISTVTVALKLGGKDNLEEL